VRTKERGGGAAAVVAAAVALAEEQEEGKKANEGRSEGVVHVRVCGGVMLLMEERGGQEQRKRRKKGSREEEGNAKYNPESNRSKTTQETRKRTKPTFIHSFVKSITGTSKALLLSITCFCSSLSFFVQKGNKSMKKRERLATSPFIS